MFKCTHGSMDIGTEHWFASIAAAHCVRMPISFITGNLGYPEKIYHNTQATRNYQELNLTEISISSVFGACLDHGHFMI